MISDNYVTGDNIYLRELQNFFFETLGMMSITHYGAIGDGRTDNYGPIQVAIDDAHRRGLSFLYVPYGRFIYAGELIHLEDITFVGNPKAHIVNIRTGEEIKIYQFGWMDGTFCTTSYLENNYYSKEEVEALIEEMITGKEDKSNKVTSISSSSTNTEYPSALATYYFVNSAINNSRDNNFVVCSLTSDEEVTQDGDIQVPFGYDIKVGSAFNVADHGVKVVEDVDCIRISAQVQLTSGTDTLAERQLIIMETRTQTPILYSSMLVPSAQDETMILSLPPVIIATRQDNNYELIVKSKSGDTILGNYQTFMTIEKVQ